MSKCRVIEGDVSNIDQLKMSKKGQDIVYVNLSGGLETMAKNIVNAMNETKVKRIIAISSISTGGDGMLH
ncbi:MAG: NAD(P)H-binding protein [Chitinophagaceae bacterium]